MSALPNTSKLPPLPAIPAKDRPAGWPHEPAVIAWTTQRAAYDKAWQALTLAQQDEWAKTLGVTLPPQVPPATFGKNQKAFSNSYKARQNAFEPALREYQKKLGEKFAANMKAIQDKIAANMKAMKNKAAAVATVAATPAPTPVPVVAGPTAAATKATNATVKAVAATPAPANSAQQAKLKAIASTLTALATNIGAMAAGPIIPAGTSGIPVPKPAGPTASAPAKGGARRRKSMRKIAKKQKKLTRRR